MQRSTKAEWARRVARWRASGLSGPAFSEREGLNVRTLRYWSWRLDKEARETAPTALSFVELPSLPEAVGMLEVVAESGHTVRVPADFDASALERLLDLLEARA